MYRYIDDLTFNIIIIESDRSIDAESVPRIINANYSAAALLGYDEKELIDKPLNLFCTPEKWENMLAGLSDEMPGKSFESELLTQAEKSIPVQISLSVLPGQNPNKTDIFLLIQDISERKALEKIQLLMHWAVEQSASAVLITDKNGLIEYINPKFTELTGYKSEELLGQNPKIMQSGSTPIEHYQSMWQNILSTGEWCGEIKNQKKNGDDYWVYECVSTIKNNRNEVTHFLAIEEDISQRKETESALRESEERFRQMAEMTGEWLWEQDPLGFYIYCSAAVNQILGFSLDEVVGKHYTDFLTPQDQVEQQSYSASHQPFYALTNHYRHRDGHPVFTESTGLPIINAEGKLLKWRGVDRDITARKHFQEALIESEKRTRLIIESSLSAIVIMDSCGLITDWNRQAEKMFGWSRNEAIGKRLEDLIIPLRFRSAHRRGLKHFLHTGNGPMLNKLVEHVAIRKDSSEFPVEVSVAPLKLGNAYIFSGFIHEITARKAAEQKIRQSEVNLAIAQSEIKIAQRIQASLSPSAPIKTAHLEVIGYCLPADQVGGDYFDYFYRDADHLDMIIADVSGHSIGPALFMVETRSALRSQVSHLGTPSETVGVLNNFLFEDLDKADYFITLFYLQYDITTQQLSFANAGHPPPLLLSPFQSECRQLDAEGMILGVRKNIIFEEKTTILSKGDLVLLYTDGLTEAENPDGDFFGVERVSELLIQYVQQSPEKIIEAFITHLKHFCQSEAFKDDITLMIFKRH